MEIKLSKRAQKYLDSVDANTRKKLYKALDKLSGLEGNIKRLEGYKNRYRYKLDHYRITFERIKRELIIHMVEINKRTNTHWEGSNGF